MQINGLKVIDATKRLTIKVTPRDIKAGDTKDPAMCAAALACIREKHCTEARVHLGRTYLKTGDKWMRYQTPESMRAEIIAFDRGAKFAPGEYVLTPLSPANLASRGKSYGSATNKSHKGPKKPRAKYHTVSGVRAHGANR